MGMEPTEPVKFNFQAGIVKRRKTRLSTIFVGLLSGAGLLYAGWSFWELGFVPMLEQLIRQVGLTDYQSFVYAGLLSLMAFMMIRMCYLLFRKKTIIGGSVAFDEKDLKIVKGKERYIIPESEIPHLQFELKKLPSTTAKSLANIQGGNYMKIPTKNGTFNCELDIRDREQLDQLLEMVEFLQIEHDVKVKVKELK